MLDVEKGEGRRRQDFCGSARSEAGAKGNACLAGVGVKERTRAKRGNARSCIEKVC